MINILSIPSEQRTRFLEGLFVFAGAVVVAGFVLKPELALGAFILCAAVWFVGLVGEALRGRSEGIIVLWMTAFPLGYYFLSFPREASIVTLDRVAVLISIVGIFLSSRRLMEIPKALRWAGIAWLAFTVIAAMTLRKSPNVLNSARY